MLNQTHARTCCMLSIFSVLEFNSLLTHLHTWHVWHSRCLFQCKVFSIASHRHLPLLGPHQLLVKIAHCSLVVSIVLCIFLAHLFISLYKVFEVYLFFVLLSYLAFMTMIQHFRFSFYVRLTNDILNCYNSSCTLPTYFFRWCMDFV